MGPVESAVRRSIRVGEVLQTPARGKSFVVDSVDDRGVVLLFGRMRTRTPFSWAALEGVRIEFKDRGWIVIGGWRSVEGNPGTLDGYLKGIMKRDTAGWIASLLDAAGVAELERGHPGRIRILD